MRIHDARSGSALQIDLVKCETGDPCRYDHACRIHKLYRYLKNIGLIDPRTSLDGEPPRADQNAGTRARRITLTPTDIEGVRAARITEHWPYNAAPRFVTLTLEELYALELEIPAFDRVEGGRP